MASNPRKALELLALPLGRTRASFAGKKLALCRDGLIDRSRNRWINTARERAAAQSFAVEFEIGDAQALRFADASFDARRTERMLMHVPDADRAFAEMVRVIRRGGRLSRCDFDWETQIVDNPYVETNPPDHAVVLRQL